MSCNFTLKQILMGVRSFFNNIFGTIGNTLPLINSGKDFVPIDGKGETIKITGESAVWLGLRNRNMQKRAYEACYPLASVLDKLAEYDIAGEVLILRSKGKGKDDLATNDWSQRMNKLLAQPNPLQSWEQFRSQQLVYARLFGFCPVFPIVPVGFGPEHCVSMWNLPPWLFSAVPTGDLFYTSKLSDIVKEYRVTILGKQITLTSDQVFILEDGLILDENESFLLPQSKVVGLDMAISNICAAMEADNVLLRKKGPLGFISHDAAATKDSVAGYLPMTAKQKQEVQQNLQQYGMSWDQFQYVVTRVAMKWNAMSFDVKQLGTKETVVAGSKAICQRWNMPYILFEQSDATYANGENAESAVYTGNVIPKNKKDLNKYNKFFKAEENQCKIVGCFDDIAALQEDELDKNTANLTLAQKLAIEWVNGIITKNQWLIASGWPAIGPEGDVYYTAPTPQPTNNNQSDNGN